MTALVARRLLQAIPTLFITSIAVFAIIHAVPGDAATVLAGPNASLETVEAVRSRLGLDEPVWRQYLIWLGNVFQGDLGTSYFSQRTVTELIAQRLPATLQLAAAALLIGIVIGVGAGILAAIFENRLIDKIVSTAAGVGIALPGFWFGLLLILGFSLYFDLLPPGGRVPFSEGVGSALSTLILPAFALSLNVAAMLARFTRASMVETLRDDYVRTAQAKGVSPAAIVIKHGLRNALIPVTTVLGIQIGRLIGGAVVIEAVFAWPGIGRLLIASIEIRDFAIVQGVLLFIVTIFVLANLVVDLAYGWLDPRIQLKTRA